MNEIASSESSGARRLGGWTWLYVTLVGSLLLRLSLFDFESGDYTMFLSRWYDYFLAHGRWSGLATINADAFGAGYPPLYLYLMSLSTLVPIPKLYAIKLLSVAADYVAAAYLWQIARLGFPGGRLPWALVTAFLFLPTVVMNGALWGQCDMMYTACFVASLHYLLARRQVAALVAFGFACSLKPQAIFWCPLLAGLFLTGRLRWKWIWVPAAVYVAWGIPQMLAGRPVLDVLLHWAKVSNTPGQMTFGATNWYQWVFEQHPEVFSLTGIVLTLAATALFVLWMMEVGQQPVQKESSWLVSWAFLSVLFPPFLLPGMHERYFFAADVLAVIYGFYFPRMWWATVLVPLASAFSYLPYLFQEEPVPRWLLSLVMLAVIGAVVGNMLRPTFSTGNNPGVES